VSCDTRAIKCFDSFKESVKYFAYEGIHSYSFNVEVDITQLQTDREARKEDRIIYICRLAVSSN